ncbi:hypothetical protein [Leifsonia shinshuensis]
MNDTPDSDAPRLVSRRTVAKTAAWAAPAIALAAASPAHAASPAKDPAGVIGIDKSTYTLEPAGAYVGRITGTITPAAGGDVPADLVLTASVEDAAYFEVLAQPVLSDDRRTFELIVHGLPTGARTGRVTISAANHANWVPAEAALEKEFVTTPPPVGTPTLVYDQFLFESPRGGTTTLTGKILVPEGTQLPEGDIALAAYSAIEGWEVVGGVTLVGNTFSFDVKQTQLVRHFGYFTIVWLAPNLGAEVKVPFAHAYTWDGVN